jgi:hypothetical protein
MSATGKKASLFKDSKGTKIAAKTRQHANQLSDEERQQADKELRQFEADRRSWDKKLVDLQNDLETGPQKISDGYEVRARQLEPIGLVYLWPATN